MKNSPQSIQKQFLNRELGLLAFNRRVLNMAQSDDTPLLERLRYLCIVSSNLDEFFEIRVAGLKQQINQGITTSGPDGLPPQKVFELVSQEAHALIDEQYALLNDIILPRLALEGICFHRRGHWTEEQKAWARDYFFREIFPVLTPIGLDPAHPFPRILNKSLNFAVELSGVDAFGRNATHAVVQAPRSLPRFIRLPEKIAGCPYGFIFLSSILHANVGELFQGMTVNGCYQFRVTRNSELFLEEEDAKNLRLALEGELSHRQFGDEVRLEVAENCSDSMASFLLNTFELSERDLYRVNGPVNLVRLMQVADMVDRPDLRFPRFNQNNPKELNGKNSDIFTSLKKKDVLLHHPFQSFSSVVDFIAVAAQDPQVLAIKQTVYRAGTDSELIEALIDAAHQGKEVTVVVELLARFDEEANINWAAKLEEAGAHVVYGVYGFKTHAKMALVIRRENGVLKRYVHLGTGNYHSKTTKIYTDFGLLTAHEGITSDVNEVFLQITGLGKHAPLKHLFQSPFTLHPELIHAIQKEISIAQAGRQAHIIAKMNSLTEPSIIQELYQASQAGVKVDLIVRGVCLLRPGVKNLSENIRVFSIIGRFLEHHRIFYFQHDVDETVYISSADWMERNFFRRIEVCVPILDNTIKKRVLNEGLKPYLRDNLRAWQMDSNGTYHQRQPRSGKGFDVHHYLLNRYDTNKS
ncbi:polyphosphate kinase 1 [Ferrovum sp. PN-J185]|uniref:polyphosphate kinase 1 n=1 Tax=Ferrovum sp. PN-J185 TaxID=1356306 RepID=UPI000799CFDB|nr:polyphosphate kinase 1 [Ferrovum sp. PN-J185]KXW56172.1 polyphosphate kinase [Ferrovum sp. PN-J185]MCC6067766.1 polyphosphate kinase 1 [Ferrovum sp. PN-J185]MDE1892216.1 polyphosphate kinase 1 [Betaproteobacteria bacterium]MDE2056814.1 polyphosphate kinase 1 [Betaproteobacteria bacterium]